LETNRTIAYSLWENNRKPLVGQRRNERRRSLLKFQSAMTNIFAERGTANWHPKEDVFRENLVGCDFYMPRIRKMMSNGF
jgi:hypothetical protein